MDEIRRAISRCPVKTYQLTFCWRLLTLSCCSPGPRHTCNASLREGFPANQKETIITPVPKKASLDLDEPKSYRPISNLSFVSKLIERIVSEQVRSFLIESDLMLRLPLPARSLDGNHLSESNFRHH